ncbi:MAG: hypothetical protein OQL05_09650 [Gammaproteobacteria bacterium]|nr:hypothetical protein [Gammaproteobacteria bacterium]MCW8992664.1 hypothetical protein [Gammaproteobacteria bacterium]
MALLGFICALYLSLQTSWFAWLFTFVALWLTWDALRNGTVWHGFDAFRAGNISAVRNAMEQTRWPNMLSPRSLAYYHWLKGVVDMADSRFAAAKVHLLVAASGSLHTENDRSLVHCLLGEIALQEQESEVAREHLRHARALQHRPHVDRIIASLSARLNS